MSHGRRDNRRRACASDLDLVLELAGRLRIDERWHKIDDSKEDDGGNGAWTRVVLNNQDRVSCRLMYRLEYICRVPTFYYFRGEARSNTTYLLILMCPPVLSAEMGSPPVRLLSRITDSEFHIFPARMNESRQWMSEYVDASPVVIPLYSYKSIHPDMRQLLHHDSRWWIQIRSTLFSMLAQHIQVKTLIHMIRSYLIVF